VAIRIAGSGVRVHQLPDPQSGGKKHPYITSLRKGEGEDLGGGGTGSTIEGRVPGRKEVPAKN